MAAGFADSDNDYTRTGLELRRGGDGTISISFRDYSVAKFRILELDPDAKDFRTTPHDERCATGRSSHRLFASM